jgi:hypothetical protein
MTGARHEENAMTMKARLVAAVAMTCAALTLASAVARADEVPLVTGEQWMRSTNELKKAYLVGLANALQVENAYQGTSPPSDAQSIVPRFARGLKGQTLDSVRESLDRWYAAHPDRLQRPVIETVWFEMVVPGLRTN